jgi:hypothetical protein
MGDKTMHEEEEDNIKEIVDEADDFDTTLEELGLND